MYFGTDKKGHFYQELPICGHLRRLVLARKIIQSIHYQRYTGIETLPALSFRIGLPLAIGYGVLWHQN